MCSHQVGHASGERGLTLIDAAPTFENYAVELMCINGARATRLAALTLRHVGEMLDETLAAGCASMSRLASET